MSQLPTNRTAQNTPTDHLADHNELSRLHNILDAGPLPDISNWVALGSLGASTTLTGDTLSGAWTSLGTIGSTQTLTG